MAVPYMANVLKGWTKKRTITVVTKTIVNHKTVESTSDLNLDINIQPVPQRKIDQKQDGERAWQWFSIIIKGNGNYFSKDDRVVIGSRSYRIMNASDWRESGFTKYEAIEDYS